MGASARVVLLGIATSVAAMAGCVSKYIPVTQPISSSGADELLDRGQISVEVSLVREVPPGANRVDLSELLSATKVFDALESSQQSRAATGSVTATGLSGSVGTLLPTSHQTQTGYQRTISPEDSTPTTSASATESTTESAPAAPAPPSPVASLSSPDTGGLAPAYHHLLYATADTILGGEALEDLYNIKSIPSGWRLFIVPIIASFEPGRITRENYVGEATLTLSSASSEQATQDGDIQIIAVAPAGFADVGTQTFADLRRLQLAFGLQAPVDGAEVAAKFANLEERLDSLAKIVVRPELQVDIQDGSTLHIRYLGTMGFKRDISLQPTVFNLEAIVLARGTALSDQYVHVQGSSAQTCSALPHATSPSGTVLRLLRSRLTKLLKPEKAKPSGEKASFSLVPAMLQQQTAVAQGASAGTASASASPGAVVRRWLPYAVHAWYRPAYAMANGRAWDSCRDTAEFDGKSAPVDALPTTIEVSSVSQDRDKTVVVDVNRWPDATSNRYAGVCVSVYGGKKMAKEATFFCGSNDVRCARITNTTLAGKNWAEIRLVKPRKSGKWSDANCEHPSEQTDVLASLELPVSTAKEPASKAPPRAYSIAELKALLTSRWVLIRVKYTGPGKPKIYVDGRQYPLQRNDVATNDKKRPVGGEAWLKVPLATSQKTSERTLWVSIANGKNVSTSAVVATR